MTVSFYSSLESRTIWPELPLLVCISLYPGFPGGTANAGDVRDAGVIPGSERSPGGGRGNPVQYSRIPWTEESGRLQSGGLKRIRPD